MFCFERSLLELTRGFHRDFKLLVKSTNMFNLSSALVKKEQFRQALGFAFARCFDTKKGNREFLEAIKIIREKCPNLSEDLDCFGAVLNDEFDAELSTIDVEADEKHLEPRAARYLSARDIAAKNDALLGIQNPRIKNRDSHFMKLFLSVLEKDYRKKSIMFGNEKLQWARKMS